MWSRSASMTPLTVCSAPTTRWAPAPVAVIRSVTASISADVASGWKMTSMWPARMPRSAAAWRLVPSGPMTTRAKFNAEEWAVVTTAPVLAGTLVITAEKGGSVRESVAMSQAYAAARQQEPGELLSLILTTPPAMGPHNAPKSPGEPQQPAPAELRRALRILERLATDEEVVAYKRFVYA